MEANIFIPFLTALVPLVIGAIWYNPRVLGTAWMKASGMTEERIRTGNMVLIFGLTYVFGLLISVALITSVVHQTAFFSILGTEPPDSSAAQMLEQLMEQYGDKDRNFGHGAFHGIFFGLFNVLPVIAVISLFERKGFKYIAIHAGYWLIVSILIGGLVAQFF